VIFAQIFQKKEHLLKIKSHELSRERILAAKGGSQQRELFRKERNQK